MTIDDKIRNLYEKIELYFNTHNEFYEHCEVTDIWLMIAELLEETNGRKSSLIRKECTDTCNCGFVDFCPECKWEVMNGD